MGAELNPKAFENLSCGLYIGFISKLVDHIFNETLPRARKERQITPQTSAGYLLSINSLLAIRKAQRGRDKKASEK